jgi:hypothetical protein
MKKSVLSLALAFALPVFAQTGVQEMPPSTHFEVNANAIMDPRPGSLTRRVRVGGEGGAASYSIGAFRISCRSTHMGFFDPIIYPGIDQRSHLHNFFGNSSISYDTDSTGLADDPHASTCRGGSINKSGYWIPAMIDTRTGKPIPSTNNSVYYKSTEGAFYDGSQAELELITVPAVNLRMIAGTPSASTAGSVGTFDCNNIATGVSTRTSHIPTDCPGGTHEIIMIIRFPNCWDGVNLDSPNHQAHMAYSSISTGCPSTHPVPIPVISFNVHWSIETTGDTAHWRLSSDTYPTSIPAGYSAHGDWWNGWEQEYLETIVNNCVRKGRDCADGELGATGDPLPSSAGGGYEMY